MREIIYAEAISEALVQGMQEDPSVFVFGLGVDDFKGIFGTTKEATRHFAPQRVFDTPASENALTGIAIGAALNGKRPILVHARNDFMFLTLDQMLNNAAKWKYVYAGKSSVPFVVRSIIGKGWGQGATHSQSLQAIFTHFPGLYVAMPSTPHDAKGILLESLKLDTPTVILEHRTLYNTKGPVPGNSYRIPFGQAKVVRPGKDVTVVATSLMVLEAVKAANVLAKEGIELEVVDPITLKPLDEETIIRSVEKTGRLICADVGWLRCGFASEVAATVAEKAFHSLKKPIRRITWPECPCPVSRSLEDIFYPTYHDIVKAAFELVDRVVPDHLPVSKEIDSFMGPY